MNTITPADVRKWQNTLVSARKPDGDPYKPTYLRSIHSRFSALMNYAVNFYHLPANPCRASGSIGAKKRKEFSFWTLDQFNQAIAYVDAPAKHLALMILFWLGLREGECLALTAADLGDDGISAFPRPFTAAKGVNSLALQKATTASVTWPHRISSLTNSARTSVRCMT